MGVAWIAAAADVHQLDAAQRPRCGRPIAGTKSRKLSFSPDPALPLQVYVDSNWSSSFSSSGGFLFFFGCPFAWFAKTQKSVSLSTAEAEYSGAMLAAKEAIFAREELIDLGFAPNGPTTIFSDSKSAVDMAFDPVAFKNTKHILRAAQFLRDLVARLVVTMEHIAGTEMIADMLTKPLGRVLFVRLLSLLDN